MNYFIDFEATQFSEEIISVGCIREDGETFYSLVAPAEGKITPFITNLTGITKEMIETAMSPDAVFNLFYDWAFASDDTPEFFAWGNCDTIFLKNSFTRTTSKQARLAMGYMIGNLTDYSQQFCTALGMNGCSLLKAYRNLIDVNMTQNHNALDDAVMLYKVYAAIQQTDIAALREQMQITSVSTPAAPKPAMLKWNEMGLPVGTICLVKKGGICFQSFANLDEAIDWIIKYKKSPASREVIGKRIKAAYSGGKGYYTLSWKVIE